MPDAAPQGTHALVHRTDIQVRFADTDAMGHINNTSYALYAEAARIDFLRGLGQDLGALILAHLAIDFRRQVNYGDEVWVETSVERLGRSSVTLRQGVMANGSLGAEMRSVAVHYDYAAEQARELPAAVRSRLEPYLVAG